MALQVYFSTQDKNKILEATGNWVLSFGKRIIATHFDQINVALKKKKCNTPTPSEAPSSLAVISSTGWWHYDGGEMIIRAGDRLSQYKCN